ncbi:MAG: kynureninase [Chloroflexota bacterium]
MPSNYKYSFTKEFAVQLDYEDPLAGFRNEFVIENPDLIYLDGNSLGRLPKRTVQRLQDFTERQWGERLIRSWNEGWLNAPMRTGGKVAQLVGAAQDEVIVTDSTSTNLFKLVVAALQYMPDKKKIVTDDLNFPSDIYILQQICAFMGNQYHLEVLHSPDGMSVPTELITSAVDGQTALLTLSHTAYKSGFTYDMGAITELAHQAGALVLWDLCHSAGAVPIALNDANADLAVGCTYKYLNGGPGSPAFLYVRRSLQDRLSNPIAGWFSQKNQFAFNLNYEPAADIRRFMVGSPFIMQLYAVEAGVEVLLEAGMERLRAKSVSQTDYLIALWEEWLEPLGYALKSPRESAQRGSHISLGHKEGMRIDKALIEEMNVIPDFREPDNIRLGIAPIYTRYVDIYEAVIRMRQVVTDHIYEKYSSERLEVT